MTDASQPPWVISHCVITGCNVAIRHRLGQLGNPQCQWHQAGTARYSPEYKPSEAEVTR